MDSRDRLSSAPLYVLLLILVAELAIYQIAVPATLPPDRSVVPPLWHQVMEYVGLFFFYFASSLSLAVLIGQLARYVRPQSSPYPLPFGILFALCGALFTFYAGTSILALADDRVQFLLEATFTAVVAALLLAQFVRGGDWAVKFGLILLALPFLLHFYGPFSVRFVGGEEALWQGLPEQIQRYGQRSLVAAALVAPLCFSPRPLSVSLSRPGPLGVGVFVGLVGVMVLRSNYDAGMTMASEGLGIEIGPAAPIGMLAIYLLALATGTWALVTCLTSEQASRRHIGLGIGLVFAAGYGFRWPLQYAAAVVGLFAISEGARYAAAEGREAAGADHRYRAPPIDIETWQWYVKAVLELLRTRFSPNSTDTGTEADSGGTGPGIPSTVTVRGDAGRSRTHVVAAVNGIPTKLTIEREDSSVIQIQIVCGSQSQWEDEPAWTLEARPEHAVGAHPPAPRSAAPPHRSGDATFDARFRLRDRGGLTDRLLDDGLRARAAAIIDGWLAFWPGKGLVYRVYPGRGAPLDHPIPITELAFRGTSAPAPVERMETLLNFLAEVAERGGLSGREG